MEVLSLGLLSSIRKYSKHFLIRSAGSIVRTIGGIKPADLLTADSLYPEKLSRGNGLVVVGSYVQLTQTQFEHTCHAIPDLARIELDVEKILSAETREQEEEDASRAIGDAFDAGKDVLFFTSRRQVSSEMGQVVVGRLVSDSVVGVVQRLKSRLDWIVTKGGITSYDVAKKGLGMRSAEVKGQIEAGIPVWVSESCTALVIMPGNVGNEETMTEIVRKLRRAALAQRRVNSGKGGPSDQSQL